MHWRRRLVEDVRHKILPIILTDVDSTRQKEYVHVDIRFESLDGVQGFCMECDEGEYEIVLNRNQCREELIVNMCHELVHVMQVERGDKFDYTKNYCDQVHEIEAYNKQEILADVYNTLSK